MLPMALILTESDVRGLLTLERTIELMESALLAYSTGGARRAARWTRRTDARLRHDA